MSADKIRDAFRSKPFRPFAVWMADGRSIPVKHPDYALLCPLGRTLVVYQPDSTMDILDVRLITDLQCEPA